MYTHGKGLNSQINRVIIQREWRRVKAGHKYVLHWEQYHTCQRENREKDSEKEGEKKGRKLQRNRHCIYHHKMINHKMCPFKHTQSDIPRPVLKL